MTKLNLFEVIPPLPIPLEIKRKLRVQSLYKCIETPKAESVREEIRNRWKNKHAEGSYV